MIQIEIIFFTAINYYYYTFNISNMFLLRAVLLKFRTVQIVHIRRFLSWSFIMAAKFQNHNRERIGGSTTQHLAKHKACTSLKLNMGCASLVFVTKTKYKGEREEDHRIFNLGINILLYSVAERNHFFLSVDYRSPPH